MLIMILYIKLLHFERGCNSMKKHLDTAKSKKDDEFYTLYEDIEKELIHYKEKFKDKVVYCNCDDICQSNFWRFFHYNFEEFGIKQLIATNYSATPGEAYKAVYAGGNDYNIFSCDLKKLEGNGDFRSEECIEVLKQADIVCTNPPFSLFRDFIQVMLDNDKQYLIVAANTCLSQHIVITLFLNNKVKTGFTKLSKFLKPNGTYSGVCCHWLTTIDIYIPKNIEFKTTYDSSEYVKYDNYDAIEIPSLNDIPNDYNDIMGIPVTYLMYHNKDKFDILGSSGFKNNYYFRTKYYENSKQHSPDGKITNGSKVNTSTVIAYDTPPVNKTYYTADNSDKYLFMQFARIFIKRVK